MAHKGCDFSQELERYREYLRLLVRLQVDGQWQGKLDLSGIVQQTLLEAHQGLTRKPAGAAPIRSAWLRQILANNLRDEIRKLGAAMRDVSRECSLETALAASSARLEAWLAVDQSSPSQRAMQEEQLLALAGALAQLPEDQRRAVELHHLQGRSLDLVAQALQRTRGATASLLFRALRKLRELLTEAGQV